MRKIFTGSALAVAAFIGLLAAVLPARGDNGQGSTPISGIDPWNKASHTALVNPGGAQEVAGGWDYMGTALFVHGGLAGYGAVPNTPQGALTGTTGGPYYNVTASNGNQAGFNAGGFNYFMAEWAAGGGNCGNVSLQEEDVGIDATWSFPISPTVNTNVDPTDQLFGGGVAAGSQVGVVPTASSANWNILVNAGPCAAAAYIEVRLYGSYGLPTPIAQFGAGSGFAGQPMPTMAIGYTSTGGTGGINYPTFSPALLDGSDRMITVSPSGFASAKDVDALDMGAALGAPTTTSLTNATSVKVGTVAASTSSATNCYKLICTVDVEYRITNGASTALATDNYLPAKTASTWCSGTSAQTDVTVLPSATATNGCTFTSLQALP